MPVDVSVQKKEQGAEPHKEQVAVTRELLRSHFKRAKEAQQIANQHDEMVQKLALELAKMEAEAIKMQSEPETEAQNIMGETPSIANRGLLFNRESRDMDVEFQKLSLDLSDLNPVPNKASLDTSKSSSKSSNKSSPNSKYLLTQEDNECLSFFEGILKDSPDDSASERSYVSSGCFPRIENGQTVFHSATPTGHVWPELSGSPEVFLHVYNVAEFSGGLQSLLTSFGTGAYHVGVEVYGKEWSYCSDALPGSGSGLDMLRVPKKHPNHQYHETVPLGATFLSPADVKALVEELEGEWQAVDYNALRRNCVTFAEKFCARLHVDPPPERVGSLTKGLKMFLFA